ncbi:MAG: polysaccharide biosynthesis protein [Lachnospiraceae bacterium]|nr:polysaccharide biosynthesis protein [Lachnospiraceae bacterium]
MDALNHKDDIDSNNENNFLVNNAGKLKVLALIFVDLLIIWAAYFLALFIRFEFNLDLIPQHFKAGLYQILPYYSLTTIIIFAIFKLYKSVWRYASVVEMYRVIVAVFVTQIPAFAMMKFWKMQAVTMPKSFWVFGFILMSIGVMAVRFGYRFARAMRMLVSQKSASYADENVMIIGAGSAGKMIAHEIIFNDKIKSRLRCFIDDDPSLGGNTIDGVPIVGSRNDIVAMVEQYEINKIIFAIPAANSATRKAILKICQETGCEIQTLPGIDQLVGGKVSVSRLRHVKIEDLLGRDEVVVNSDEIHDFISGNVIMVTGGGGSIGSELCRQIAKEGPDTLIIFDIYENNAYAIQQELKMHLPNVNVLTLIGSVRNTNRVNDILKRYKPSVIFHAAAHKHVPLMEDSPNEAIKNNVLGTYKMAQAAARHGVKRFILISTDKAVNPTNIMGASKRLCEMVVQMMNRTTNTEFAAVRFGNVLGSNGSVIPLFEKQIAEGGPVTVTDPRIIRYFMTIPEAVALVLQAGIYAKGGEIFVLDMGDPVKIDDMARNLIKLSGLEPDVDIMVEYTGLRPGEKLYEEMLMDEEGLQETPNKLIHIGKPIEMDDDAFKDQLVKLESASKGESMTIKKLVAEIVPTYHPSGL